MHSLNLTGFNTRDGNSSENFIDHFTYSEELQKGLIAEDNPQMLINASIFTGGKVVVSGGCAPIFMEDELVGAYGISGGTSDQDEEMAIYARQKAGFAHRPLHDSTPAQVKKHIEELYTKAGIDTNKL